MNRIIKKACGSEMIRYLFFGGCTTGVNLAVFYILRYGISLSLRKANLAAIVTAILFAFVVNKWCVFCGKETGLKRTITEFAGFMGMRCITLALEYFGVLGLAKVTGLDMVSKLLMQVVVILLNYLFSKFLVFGCRQMAGGVVHG